MSNVNYRPICAYCGEPCVNPVYLPDEDVWVCEEHVEDFLDEIDEEYDLA